MADIPGIIDGTSEGRGLGLEFLNILKEQKHFYLLLMLQIIEQWLINIGF